MWYKISRVLPENEQVSIKICVNIYGAVFTCFAENNNFALKKALSWKRCDHVDDHPSPLNEVENYFFNF